jgi:tetratricopeptide (TPR) repeat protein
MVWASLEDRERLLGRDDIQTLGSVHMLALVLQYQGKYEQAEQLNRRALAGREKELGENHPDTLTSVYCLADLLLAQQDYMEALRLYDRAVKGYLQALGPSHPTTLACQRHRQLLLQDTTLFSVK